MKLKKLFSEVFKRILTFLILWLLVLIFLVEFVLEFFFYSFIYLFSGKQFELAPFTRALAEGFSELDCVDDLI